jgi:hypothetical protein
LIKHLDFFQTLLRDSSSPSSVHSFAALATPTASSSSHNVALDRTSPVGGTQVQLSVVGSGLSALLKHSLVESFSLSSRAFQPLLSSLTQWTLLSIRSININSRGLYLR